jgi:hypothetical protein
VREPKGADMNFDFNLFVKLFPEIIRESSTSPIALIALICLVVSLVVLLLFGKEGGIYKLIAFSLFIVSLVFLGNQVLIAYEAVRHKNPAESDLPKALLAQISGSVTFDYVKSLIGTPQFESSGLGRFRKSGYKISVRYSPSEGNFHRPRNAVDTVLIQAEGTPNILTFDGWWNSTFSCSELPCPRIIRPEARLGGSTLADFIENRTSCYLTSEKLTKNEYPLFKYKCKKVILYIDDVREFFIQEHEANADSTPDDWLDLARHYFDKEEVFFDQSEVQKAEERLQLDGKSEKAKRDAIQNKLFAAALKMQVTWFQLQLSDKEEIDWFDFRD